MIALRKLQRQPTRSRLRKTAELLRRFEADIHAGREIDSYYLAGLCGLLYRSDTDERLRRQAAELERDLRAAGLSLGSAVERENGRRCGALSAALRESLGILPGDWDLDLISGPAAPRTERRVLELDLYLETLRSPFNVGSIFRSAESFGVRRIYLAPGTPSPEQPRAKRSAMGTVERIPWDYASLEEALEEASRETSGYTAVALETGGRAIGEFEFPGAGLLIIGNEEWGVSPAALALAERRLTIPMGGSKASLNAAVATGIALQRWFEALAGA